VQAILLGTSVSGRAEAAGRELPAQESLAALTAAGVAHAVNLAFHDDSPGDSRLEQLRVLRLDARLVSRASGPRKPIVTEMLDVLAAEAERRGIVRIGLVNGDIAVTADAIAQATGTPRPALGFSRTDIGPGEPEALLLHGVDMFTFDVGFWRRERRRFRAYVLGEPVWDNVFAAVAVCHGGELLNRERLLLHQRHPAAFADSPYARYVHLLAARDSSYFSLWCAYVARAEALRERGGTREQEEALQREIFRAPGLAAEAVDIARATWWRARQVLGA
jgi:hypothetical protein